MSDGKEGKYSSPLEKECGGRYRSAPFSSVKTWNATGRVWVCCGVSGEPSKALAEVRALFRAGLGGFWLQLDLNLLPAGPLSSHHWTVHPKPASSVKSKSKEQPSKDGRLTHQDSTLSSFLM